MRDTFVYSPQESKGAEGPVDGTSFVYGSAGPPSGRVVYDPTHHVAFYEQGCCSWHEAVAAIDFQAPPKPVKRRDLSQLETERGIRLGQTIADVTKIYGHAVLQRVPGRPEVSFLAYTTLPLESPTPRTAASCGQFDNFFFRNNRLILIQLEDGC